MDAPLTPGRKIISTDVNTGGFSGLTVRAFVSRSGLCTNYCWDY